MHKEYECTILEIDTKFISKLENMGAKKIGEYFQKDMYMSLIQLMKINGLD